MEVRFQADADLNQIILPAVTRREPAIDFRTALDAGFEGVADADVLARAAADGRVLVTHDRKSMPQTFADFIAGGTSPGLLVIPQSLSVVAAADELILIWSATQAEERTNRVCILPI